jgi:PAS domain S-box-containing protein
MDPEATQRASLLERELLETREREVVYRGWLAEAAERTQRLRQHTGELLETLGKRPPKQRDLMRTLTDTARVSSRALGVGRTSLWLFDSEGVQLTCKLLLADESAELALDGALSPAVSPAYFRALRSSGVIAVTDVHEDPRMVGLEEYLERHAVSALLDISIAVPGELMGVVCHEHTGGPRVWHPEEIDFATHVGNLIALALEVERRQLAEAKALSAEAKYRYLVESLPVTVYSFDAFSQTIEYLSPQIRELGSFDADEWLARGIGAWLAAIHEDDRALAEARFAPHGVDQVAPEIQYRVMLPQGGMRYLRDQCRVVRNHAGEPVAIQGVIADITEQRLSEGRALELERRMRTLLENVDLLGIIVDREGRFEFVNACFERTTGYSAADALGQDCFALLMPASEAAARREYYERELRRGGLAERFEHEICTRSGERRRVVWTTVLLRAEDGTPEGTCSLGLDITDRAKHEAELRQQTKLESLGELSAGVAHDFNNLLTVMTVQADLLARTHCDAESQTSFNILSQSLRQAAELTRSLLVYARREPVSPTALEVDGLIVETTPLLATMAGSDVELVTSLCAPDVRVVIDPSQLRQLLMNLTSNAVFATREHGKQVHISTALELLPATTPTRAPGHYLVLSVSDDGRGMDASTLARVFEPFFTTKPQGRGTGLGLSMCQSIVARAGGFIQVQSERGQGTTCRAYFPVAPVAIESDASPLTAARPERAGLSALVVEDEMLIRRLLTSSLEELGLRVEAVGTVADAMRIAAVERFDLLVTDGSLPDGSGRTLARSARAARPQLRVLLVSGAPEDTHEFDATLLKPFTRAGLNETVSRLLASPARA